jgi:hypothetical protein
MNCSILFWSKWGLILNFVGTILVAISGGKIQEALINPGSGEEFFWPFSIQYDSGLVFLFWRLDFSSISLSLDGQG